MHFSRHVLLGILSLLIAPGPARSISAEGLQVFLTSASVQLHISTQHTQLSRTHSDCSVCAAVFAGFIESHEIHAALQHMLAVAHLPSVPPQMLNTVFAKVGAAPGASRRDAQLHCLMLSRMVEWGG